MTTVTWIAPIVETLPKLALLDELGRIGKINNVEIRTHTGVILLDDVANALSVKSNILIWSGHGEPDGLLLSDGRKVRSKWLATQVARGCQPHVAILAACGSHQRDAGLNTFSATFSRQGVNVVGFPADASDTAAGTFIVEYVRSLAMGASVMDGFDVALEAIDTEDTAVGVFLTPGLRNVPINLEDELRQIRYALERMEAKCITLRSIEEDGQARSTQAHDGTSAVRPSIRPLSRGTANHVRGLTRTDRHNE